MLALLLVASALAAPPEGPVYPKDIARSHVLRSFMLSSTGLPLEEVPSGLEQTIVQDEARVVSLDKDTACFEVVTRTSLADENDVATWEFLVGQKKQVWPDQPQVQVFDYAYTGQRTLVDLSVFTRSTDGSFRVTEPEDRIYRVLEKTWKLCSSDALDRKGRLVLKIKGKPPTFSDFVYSETFRWLVQ